MKHKPANNPGWQRILQSRFYHTYLDTPDFAGHITLYCMDAVRAPLVVNYFNRQFCIADTGYAWLKQFPAGEHFTITTHFDAEGRIALWYIDVALRTGVDAEGIPWMDDLYLDIVVSPGMEVEVKDTDELLAARDCGQITAGEFELAWCAANRLLDQITNHQFTMLSLSEAHRRLLLPADD